MIRKLMICPYFGKLPPWWDLYEAQLERLAALGYHWHFDFNQEAFVDRCHDLLGVDAPIVYGEGKIHDYRATFGILYADELDGFEFWGHTDFDCVYGRPDHFVPDQVLATLDVHTDHTYVLGPWTLYRNLPAVNELFYAAPDWREQLEWQRVSGWVETGFTNVLRESGLSVLWTTNHVYERRDLEQLRWDEDRLMLGRREVPFAHFRRTKKWPEALA